MEGTFFCNKCGAQNLAGAQFCSRCGAPTTAAAGVSSPPPGPPAYTTSAASYSAAPPVAASGYGGFWIRVLAFFIDAIILRVVVAPIGLIFGALGFVGGIIHGLPHDGMALVGGGVTFILLVFGSWLYEAFLESSSYQATLGKMIFGLKVTDLNGNRISFERARGRYFAKGLSAMILCLGYIMVGFTERKQGLHDMLAGTLVLRK